jgi:hypothetical protein
MRAGFGVAIVRVLADTRADQGTEGWNIVLQEACTAMRGLCVHDDLRREMSCAYENGRFFISNASTVPALMKHSANFEEQPGLASAALGAARNLITTEEAVKVMAQHGAMSLPRAVLGFEDATVGLVRSLIGVMRNLCADDVRKDKLVSDGTLDMMIAVLSKEKYNTDSLLVEHALACLAAMTLRSPANSTRIVTMGAVEVVVNCMRKYTDKTALQRQGCLALRNIAGRCPELRGNLLDSGVENVLRTAGKYQDCVDEAYGALRDLGCEVHWVKVTEDGKIETAVQQFGATSSKLKFNPVYDETYDLDQRVQTEARAPFARDPDDEDDSAVNPSAGGASTFDDHDHDHDHDHGHHHTHDGECDH